LYERLLSGAEVAFHVIFAVALISGAILKHERFHKGLVLFVSLTFILYTLLLYARMQ
jgi:hypothetical protein